MAAEPESRPLSLAPRTSEDQRRALVLSGGGMRVCYQVGTLCALEESGYGFGFADATSGGGLNLAMLLSGRSPRDMYARWRNINLKRSLSLMPWSRYVRQQNCVAMGSAEAFRAYVLPHLGIDLGEVRAARWIEGNFNVLDYKRKVVNEVPNAELDEDLLIAGLSLPGVMPPVARGDDLFLDAAFVQDANLMAAVRAGAEEIWVLWCLGNTEQYVGGPLRLYIQMLEMAAHGALHRELREIAELNARIAAGDSPHGQRGAIRVHLIRPPSPLPLDPQLYLGRVSTADLMAQGYRDGRDYLQSLDPAGAQLDPSITRMQPPPAGVRFQETLRGHLTLEEAAPGPRAQPTDASLTLHARIHIEDIERFGNEPELSGLIHGEIDFPPLGMGIPCLTGTFRMSSPDADPDLTRVVYGLHFRHEGQDYYLAGHKRFRQESGLGRWGNTTALHSELHRGADANGPVIGSGILRLGMGDLLKTLFTWRTTDIGGLREKYHIGRQLHRLYLGRRPSGSASRALA